MDKQDNIDASKTTIIIPSDTTQKQTNKISVFRKLAKAIKEQISEISQYQDVNISKANAQIINQILIVTDSLIRDCHQNSEFKCNKNDNFSILAYEFQRLSLKFEAYKIKEEINSMEQIEKQLYIKQTELEDKYNKTTQDSNNLIYNILGFIASYSIVSAAVVTFEKVDSIEDIIIFMTFTAFILITTLIGLNNFYKNNDKNKKGLRNNYFLWKALIIVLVGMIIYKGVIYIKRNIDNISYNIGKGIETVRQLKD